MNPSLARARQLLGLDTDDPNRKLIAISAISLAVLLVWGALAQVEEVTRGIGKVVPTSKAQLVQAAAPASITAILVRSGQMVKKGQLLVRLDDTQSESAVGQLRAENERLSARAARLQQEGTGEGSDCGEGTACAEERRLAEVRMSAARSREGAPATGFINDMKVTTVGGFVNPGNGRAGTLFAYEQLDVTPTSRGRRQARQRPRRRRNARS